ncbi:MAG: hypothetical protein JST89_20600 [Cyanobacteria bacterium SZAS-4]|nr:hypothetical protein [Cyanobacteria bacterium SZAS-4]
MKKSELLFNVMVASACLQPSVVQPSVAQQITPQKIQPQSSFEQWQQLMPGTVQNLRLPDADRNLQSPNVESSTLLAIREGVEQRHFIDPFDAEMRDAQSSFRRGQWSQAWESLRRGWQSATDPLANAARLEIESQRKR